MQSVIEYEKPRNSSSITPVESWSIAAFMLCVIGIVLAIAYSDTAQSIVKIWQVSDTFGHGFLVIPAFVVLVFRQWELLEHLLPKPAWIPVVLLLPIGLMWYVGSTLGIQVVKHVAFVMSLQLVLWSVLGHQIAAVMLFPLCFLGFAAPVGDELVPMLMDVTADFTVASIRLIGIPIFREGLYFTLTSGNWSVVEACSGIRYLIASLMMCSLYAYVALNVMWTRASFMLLAIVVPIVANGMRAVLIVLLAHYSDNQLAAGVDHLVYGWLFFGVVMLVLFSIGSALSRLEGKDNTRPACTEITRLKRAPAVSKTRKTHLCLQFITIVLLVVTGPLIASGHTRSIPAQNASAEVPVCSASGDVKPTPPASSSGTPGSGTPGEWTHGFTGFDQCREHQYSTAAGDRVRVTHLSFDTQGPGREIVGWHNVLVSRSDGVWNEVSTVSDRMTIGHDELKFNRTLLRSESGERVVWWWYQFDGVSESNQKTALLRNAYTRLLSDESVAEIVLIETNVDSVHADQLLAKQIRRLYP